MVPPRSAAQSARAPMVAAQSTESAVQTTRQVALARSPRAGPSAETTQSRPPWQVGTAGTESATSRNCGQLPLSSLTVGSIAHSPALETRLSPDRWLVAARRAHALVRFSDPEQIDETSHRDESKSGCRSHGRPAPHPPKPRALQRVPDPERQRKTSREGQRVRTALGTAAPPWSTHADRGALHQNHWRYPTCQSDRECGHTGTARRHRR